METRIKQLPLHLYLMFNYKPRILWLAILWCLNRPIKESLLHN